MPDPNFSKDPLDEYDLFLQEQGLRVEKELLKQRHPNFTDLKNENFDSAVRHTTDLLNRDPVVIYGGALQSEKLGLRARPDVIKINNGTYLIEEYKLAGTTDDCGFSPFGDDSSTPRETAFQKIRARVVGTELAAKELGV